MNQRIENIQKAIDCLLQEAQKEAGEEQGKTELLHTYGVKLGRAIRDDMEEQGIEADLKSFLATYGFVRSCQQKNCIIQNGAEQYSIIHCPAADSCSCPKNPKWGNLLCQLDLAVLKGFDSNLDARIAGSLNMGSADYWFESKIILNSSLPE
ncbi:hypothetical protein Sgly_2771 [Syntrophobotulus glycolicus DSM 8271]|uniref:Uncharacterized protein n=1 Tax=Syntrophobotulus glycolicus (strain DSM 8271 / FlGlyR) TaxID=645991 RepID=F0SXY1_SYNGF|nr:hypothetical protein [Syntrophobotulus glycolicus]ADY57042.1 hypothetical protein Sgly_2771 [Syntrophobotulus glycolicus DSM 8271]